MTGRSEKNRKAKTVLFLIIALLSFHELSSQVKWQFSRDTVITWHYLEGDEFSEDKINTAYWNYSGPVRSIFTNKEQQYYTDGENHTVKDGALILNAKKKKVVQKIIDWKGDNDSILDKNKFYGLNKRVFNYKAGYLETKEPFLYGYFEIKFKSPSKKGFWPAFWLYGGSPGEEIDIMELKTEKKNKIHVGRHSAKKEENYLKYRFHKRVWGDWVKFKGDLTSGFNVVSGEWTKDHIRFYLNGECIAHTNLHLTQAKKLILNIAVPSNGPFKPGPQDSILYSGDFEIDYVRVWSENILKNTNSKTGDYVTNKVFKERKIGITELHSKNKFIYGDKKDHTKEGITLSFFHTSKNIFQLTVLGKTIPEKCFYTIKNEKGKIVFSGNLVYGETTFDFSNNEGQEYTLEAEVYGMEKSYVFKK
jgi:beta-glucanase (GH16 family)